MSENEACNKTHLAHYYSDTAPDLGTRIVRVFENLLPTFTMNYDSSSYADYSIGILSLI